jgi:hypothetical protein
LKSRNKNWIIAKLVDLIFYEGPTRARKGRQIAPQASAGYPLSLNPLLAFCKAERGREKKASMKRPNIPATAKDEYLPHDCKQYDFPSGTLKSLDI